MYDLPSQENIEEVIIDAGAAKGQSQPILVHSKNESKTKTDKTTGLISLISNKNLLQY